MCIRDSFHFANPNSKSLFTQHPLQAFNHQYFNKESKLYTYNADWLAVHDEGGNEKSSAETIKYNNELTGDIKNEDLKSEVLIEDLIRFYLHPAKYYLNKVLKVNLFFESDVLDDDEPFNLDFLQQYQVKQAVIDSFVKDSQGQTASDLGSKNKFTEGLSAFGEIGERQWQKLESSVAPVLKHCQQYMTDKIVSPIEINLSFKWEAGNETQLVGWQRNIYANNLVRVAPSKLKAKSIIPALIELSLIHISEPTRPY